MHFLSKLYNNSILTGSVDSYCLVCDNYLRSEDEAFAHTEKPIHKKNMGMAARVEKFLSDRIIKVKKGYYCPFCNILLTTTTKVTIHIGDTNHQENKGAHMLTRIGNNIIAFDEVAITLESWHGLMENTCIICNTEFDDNMHRTDLGHVLRLVQSRCEFGDRYIYRKVDEDSFYCLICASVFSINEKLNHHENTSHKNLYSSGKELKKKIPLKIQENKQATPNLEFVKTSSDRKPTDDNFEKDKAEKTDIKNIDKVDKTKIEVKPTQNPVRDLKTPGDCKIKVEVSKDKEVITLLQNSALACNLTQKHGNIIGEMNKKSEKALLGKEKESDVLDKVDEFQKKGINIDFTWDRARCKICGDNVAFSAAAIEKHIEQHSNANQINNIEPKADSQQQKKSHDSNDVKTDTSKIVPKRENKIYDIEPEKQIENMKLETEKQNRVDNAELGSEKNKIDNTVELKTDIKKLENVVEQTQDTKQLRKTSESLIDLKSTQKTENGTKPKLTKKQRKKSESLNENKTVAKKTNNVAAPNTDTKKTNNEAKPKDTKGQQKPDSEPKPDTKKELEKLAQKNNMVVMPNEVYCPQCKVGTTLTAAAINAHAISNNHKEKNTFQSEIFGKKVQTECMETFIRVESNLGSDIILNNKYVLRHHSFHCIVTEDDGYKCMLCNVFFKKTGEVNLHMNGPDHKNKLSLCKVVTSIPEEFIREITPDMYHCGYCNVMFESWTEMQDHFSDTLHRYARRHAQWNLERCHSVIRNTKLMQISSMHAINYA